MTTKFFERPQSGERAVLVHASPDGLPDESEREEFAELARSAGAELIGELVSSRRGPDPRYFIGKGKLDELHGLVREHDSELVIFSAALSPSQERNLEKALQCRVLDRAGLILDIFAQRARSFEGKLAVFRTVGDTLCVIRIYLRSLVQQPKQDFSPQYAADGPVDGFH